MKMCAELQSSHLQTLASALWEYQCNGVQCDTTLLADDGKLKAHSAVLAAASPIFSASFKSMVESQSHGKPREFIVDVSGCRLDILSILLRYCYTGELVIPECSDDADVIPLLLENIAAFEMAISTADHSKLKCARINADSRLPDVNNDTSVLVGVCQQDITVGNQSTKKEKCQNTNNGKSINASAHSGSSDADTSAVMATNLQSVGIVKTAAQDDSINGYVVQPESDSAVENTEPNMTQEISNRVCSKGGKKKTKNAVAIRPQASRVCDICGQYCKTPCHLKTHRNRHSGAHPYSCDDCGLSFTLMSNLKRHRMKHTGERRHLCQHCGQGFIQRASLVDHVSRCHPEVIGTDPSIRPFRCTQCGAEFYNSWQVRRHATAEHDAGDRGVVERAKRSSFADRQALKTPKSFQCSVCHRQLRSKPAVDYHMRSQHGTVTIAERSFKCGSCEKSFLSAAQLRYHESEWHNGAGRYRCDVCDKAFSFPSALRQHQLKHGIGCDYKCETCGRMFSSKQSLGEHQLLHTGDKPHACPICGNRYRQAPHLKNHLLTHSGVRPHQCEHCPKAYKNRIDLRIHCERTHNVTLPIIKHRRNGYVVRCIVPTAETVGFALTAECDGPSIEDGSSSSVEHFSDVNGLLAS